MIDSTNGFGQSPFKIKNIEFDIQKLPPVQGFGLAEFIRENIAKTSDGIDVAGTDDQANALLFIKSVVAFPADALEHIRRTLFSVTKFKGGGVDRGWMDLLGSEDMAFQNLETIHFYEVLGRGLYINFSGSFSGLASTFPSVGQALSRYSQKTSQES